MRESVAIWPVVTLIFFWVFLQPPFTAKGLAGFFALVGIPVFFVWMIWDYFDRGRSL